MALISLEQLKRYMKLKTDEHDELLTALAEHVSARIELVCSRRFLRHTRREWLVPGMMGYVILEQYPVASIGRMLTGKADAMTLTASWLAVRATANVTDSAVHLLTVIESGHAVETELQLADYQTTHSLATAISSLANWSATALADAATVELHRGSHSCAGGETITLTSADTPAMPMQTNHEAGTIRFDDTLHRQSVLIEYDAGYASAPYDVELVVHEIVFTAFGCARLNTDSIARYAYTLANAVELTESQLSRLRPYMAVRCA